jgi:hypothetical protein
VAIGLLTVTTVLAYAAWLGWDQHKDIGPDGETGPYQAWQVIGLVLTIGIIAAVAGWRGHSVEAIVMITLVLTVAFSIDASTDPEADGLWLVGAFMLFVGSLVGVSVVALAAELVGRPTPPAVPPPAGWYGDPAGEAGWRYWDGQNWTAHVD